MTITNFSLHSNAKRIRPTQTKMAAIAVNLLKQVRPRRNIANRANKNFWNMSVSYPLFRNMKVHFPCLTILILFFFETAFEIHLFFFITLKFISQFWSAVGDRKLTVFKECFFKL